MSKDAWSLVEPSDEQIVMTQRVEAALSNEIRLLHREGVPVACILTGLGITICDLLTTQSGLNSVAPWFEGQGRLVRDLQRGGH